MSAHRPANHLRVVQRRAAAQVHHVDVLDDPLEAVGLASDVARGAVRADRVVIAQLRVLVVADEAVGVEPRLPVQVCVDVRRLEPAGQVGQDAAKKTVTMPTWGPLGWTATGADGLSIEEGEGSIEPPG